MVNFCYGRRIIYILYYIYYLFICVRLFVTTWTVPARVLCPWNSPDKNTGVSSRFLLQGIFLTQESNLGLLQCKQIPYHLNQGSPVLLYSYLNNVICHSTWHMEIGIEILQWGKLIQCLYENQIKLVILYFVFSPSYCPVVHHFLCYSHCSCFSHGSLGALLGWPLYPFEMSRSPFFYVVEMFIIYLLICF